MDTCPAAPSAFTKDEDIWCIYRKPCPPKQSEQLFAKQCKWEWNGLSKCLVAKCSKSRPHYLLPTIGVSQRQRFLPCCWSASTLPSHLSSFCSLSQCKKTLVSSGLTLSWALQLLSDLRVSYPQLTRPLPMLFIRL